MVVLSTSSFISRGWSDENEGSLWSCSLDTSKRWFLLSPILALLSFQLDHISWQVFLCCLSCLPMVLSLSSLLLATLALKAVIKIRTLWFGMPSRVACIPVIFFCIFCGGMSNYYFELLPWVQVKEDMFWFFSRRWWWMVVSVFTPRPDDDFSRVQLLFASTSSPYGICKPWKTHIVALHRAHCLS